MPNRRDTGSKGASGPNKGPGIGSHGEGSFLTRQGEERTKRVQANQKKKVSQGAIAKRLGLGKGKAEDEGHVSYTSGRTGGNVRGPLWGVTRSQGDVRKRAGQRAS